MGVDMFLVVSWQKKINRWININQWVEDYK